MPDGVDIREPVAAPFFDPILFPYVIAVGSRNQFGKCTDYLMLNIKQRSSQVLVKA